jgi:hypothetical protein
MLADRLSDKPPRIAKVAAKSIDVGAHPIELDVSDQASITAAAGRTALSSAGAM